MHRNTQIKPPTALPTAPAPVEMQAAHELSPQMSTLRQIRAAWPAIRWVLVIWALGVWLLLVMLPGIDQIRNATTAMLHLPTVFIGLGLLAAMLAAYNLQADRHLLWFLGVLLLLAGWM